MQDEKLDGLPGFVNTRGGYTLEQALASVGPGWSELVRAFHQACDDAGIDIVQVKEKFGGLRMYTGAAPKHILDLEDRLEQKSFRVCELCGAAGKLRTSGWMSTCCDECFEKRRTWRDFV